MARQSFFAMLVLLFSLVSGFAQAEGEATSGQININQADAITLSSLDGVGESKAEAIVTYRDSNGPFKTVTDLSNVKGIGEKTVEKNAARLTVE
ncbi:ComEA family DNA-binding protein [Marinobacter salicampi]|uniref:ComEA family DNA-binding protein n=1 Tax=Marinobacter salicampi TaxID=435907 RepID=UPI001408FC71|nr:ComEA family DNA-binding protein [Marinobacter salicampi]